MNNLETTHTTTIKPFSLGEEDFIAATPQADYSAMQAEHPESTLGLRIVAITLAFLGLLHLTGYLLVQNYGAFSAMHLFSVSVGCFTFALLTGVHLYTNKIRNPR